MPAPLLTPSERNALRMADMTFAALAHGRIDHHTGDEPVRDPIGELTEIVDRVIDTNPIPSTAELSEVDGYDYNRQAWVVMGRYQRCDHPGQQACSCYGRLHAGEAISRDDLQNIS